MQPSTQQELQLIPFSYFVQDANTDEPYASTEELFNWAINACKPLLWRNAREGYMKRQASESSRDNRDDDLSVFKQYLDAMVMITSAISS